ncbi:MAG: pyrroline-5-carboxylate reductase [Pseudomonadota bacterium]
MADDLEPVAGEPTLCLVGAGNMGGALLAGWLGAGRAAANITVIDPNPPQAMVQLIEQSGVNHATAADGVARPDIVIVAVKPQIMDSVLPSLAPLLDSDNVLVSVAAGINMERLAKPFAPVPRVVRTMPNTPSMVGRGITVCVGSDGVSKEQKGWISDLMKAVGAVEWVADESLMDAVTGVSGSGPAYIFHMVEAMAQAGEAAGLPPALALRLARATVEGGGELLHRSDDTAAQLRENVTSPNGTTAAALAVLMGDDGLPDLMTKAVAAAADRSRELAKE